MFASLKDVGDLTPQAALGPRHPVVGAAHRAVAELTLSSGAIDAAGLRTASKSALWAVRVAEAAWSEARGTGDSHKGWLEGVSSPHFHNGHACKMHGFSRLSGPYKAWTTRGF